MLVSLIACLLYAVNSLAADDITLINSEQQFSTELFQAIVANTSYTKDVFFSPYSIYSSLLTVYIASAGQTEKSLQSFLRFDKSKIPDKSNIIKQIFHESSNDKKEYTLASVDRIYYTPDIKVKKDKQVQFGDKVAVFKTKNNREDEINNWVSNHTKGIIKKLIDKETIKTESSILFVNAAYFKGYWTVPLTGGTSKRPFTLSDGTVTETLFMSTKKDLFRSITDQELNAQLISLPYKGYITMIIILPTTKPQKSAPPPLADVVKKLTRTKFQSIVSALHKQKECTTDLLIPKFKSEEKYELKPIFEAFGDKDLFTHPLDLTNLFEPGLPLIVNKIVHQANVNVYENGTEAAAATAIQVTLSAKQCPTTFHADRPFVYIIYDMNSRFIHYIGTLNSPK